MLQNKTYDHLKTAVVVILPALGAAYFSLSEIWGLPAGQQVVGTIAIITTFLGVVLRVSSTQYYNSDEPYDGKLVTTQDTSGGVKYFLELGIPPDEIPNQKNVNFKVAKPPPYNKEITDQIRYN